MFIRYLVTVCEGNRRVERMLFSDQDSALVFVDQRRKQGYYVTVDIKTLLEADKYEEEYHGNH